MTSFKFFSSYLTILLIIFFFFSSSYIFPIHSLWTPNILSSYMVLQREPQSARLWGAVTTPSSTVIISLNDNIYWKIFADSKGNWQFDLPPQKASINNTIFVTGDDETIVWSNVAFGDVYVCSGQSNMEFGVNEVFNATNEINAAGLYPNLRLFTIQKATSTVPLNDTVSRFPNTTTSWLPSSPFAVNGSRYDGGFEGYFSAMCYFSGRGVYIALNGEIPIGLVETCWSGTRIEAWSSDAALQKCGPVAPNTNSRSNTININAPDPNDPAVLYNAMIHPILNYAVQGYIWYQGSANSANATNYACRLPVMITSWRSLWNNFDAYFYTILLTANIIHDTSLEFPLIRDVQVASLNLPSTGIANSADLGDPTSPYTSIHARNKTEVGRRVALQIMKLQYGAKIVADGPSIVDVIWPLPSSRIASVILLFDPSSPASQGLQLLDTLACDYCCKNDSAIYLELNTGKIVQAMVTVYPSSYSIVATINLESYSNDVFVNGMQFNYFDYPQCTIVGNAQLPMVPVRMIHENHSIASL